MTRRLVGPHDLTDGHPGRHFLLGRTPLLASRLDQRFSYCVYVPDSGPRPGAGWPVVVAIHGTRRDVHRVREGLIGLADRHRCIVVVPLFPGGIGDPNDLHNYKVVSYEGIRFDLVLISMLDEVAERWGAQVDRVHPYGFSGGAQFAHRFAYLHPGRLASLSVGAPGRITLLDPTVPWPDGTAGIEEHFDTAVDLDGLAQIPVQIVVGADDTDPGSLAPGSTGGVTRVGRARTLVSNWRANGLSPRFDIVAGAGHDSQANLPATLSFLSAQFPTQEP